MNPVDPNTFGLGSLGSSIGRVGASVAKRAVAPKTTVSPVRRPTSSSFSSSGSSGSNSRSVATPRSSVSSGGSSAIAKVKAPPVAPSLASFLGSDSTYQNAVSGGKRSLTDFLSDLNRRRGEATTQFNQTSQSMEQDRTHQLEQLKNEFASRGLINSGLYGQKQGEFQQQFTDQSNALNQQQSALLADLLSQQTGYQRENQLAMEQAKQDALARRAAAFNIGA